MNDKPTWLRIMENSSIAEARTKAFLLDGFWILERNVDIQGADFIIQRRISSCNLLDITPPRFGIIQVKYYQDILTNHYIHYDYICDANGQPHGEFFIMAHTGTEDTTKKYLISAEEIVGSFRLNLVDNAKMYYLPGKEVLVNKYEVALNERALDRIEHAIKISDFKKNRRFISLFLPSYPDLHRDNIDQEYLIELDNWLGDIPDGIYSLKNEIKSRIQDIEDLIYELHKILYETNPEQIMNKLERICHYHGNYLGNDIYNPQLHSTVIQHKRMYEDLNNIGLLDNFILFRKELEDFVIDDLSTKELLDSLAYIVDIRYNFKNLKIYEITSEVMPLSELEDKLDNKNRFAKVLKCEKGFIRAFFVPYVFIKWQLNNQDCKDSKIEPQLIQSSIGYFRKILMEALLECLFS